MVPARKPGRRGVYPDVRKSQKILREDTPRLKSRGDVDSSK